MSEDELLSFAGLHTYSLFSRPSKVGVEQFAKPFVAGGSLKEFLAGLPRQLLGLDFPELVERVVRARQGGRPVIVGLGAHVIKVGLNPVLIDLMERSIVTALAVNGACAVHDTEIALAGKTSEDVDAVLGDGAFGAVRETAEIVNEAAITGAGNGKGFGRALGERLLQGDSRYPELSLFASAARLDMPLSVHVALGTDIVHIHPSADGAAIGRASYLDFQRFCRQVADLDGGVYLNLGSAVLMPEVFLKALTVVRNLGHPVTRLTTANFDFLRQYRSMTNVVNRPTAGEGGRGFHFTGHHELMVPLLAAAIKERLAEAAAA